MIKGKKIKLRRGGGVSRGAVSVPASSVSGIGSSAGGVRRSAVSVPVSARQLYAARAIQRMYRARREKIAEFLKSAKTRVLKRAGKNATPDSNSTRIKPSSSSFAFAAAAIAHQNRKETSACRSVNATDIISKHRILKTVASPRMAPIRAATFAATPICALPPLVRPRTAAIRVSVDICDEEEDDAAQVTNEASPSPEPELEPASSTSRFVDITSASWKRERARATKWYHKFLPSDVLFALRPYSGEIRAPSRDAPDETLARKLHLAMRSQPSMAAVRFLGFVLGKAWPWLFRSVNVDVGSLRCAREQVRKSVEAGRAIVFLPTHRSHSDYLLMSYVLFAYDMPVPLIAAGDNLAIPIIGTLFRRSGAFFIRRNVGASTTELAIAYKGVLKSYIREAVSGACALEFFVQGGRSRTGQIGRPKLGLLASVVAIDEVLIVPAAIDYEMPPEGPFYARQLLGEAKKRPESLTSFFAEFFRYAVKSIRSKFTLSRYHGGVYIRFAQPFLLSGGKNIGGGKHDELPSREWIKSAGDAICRAQHAASTVTPAAPLAMAALVSSDRKAILAHAKAIIAFASAHALTLAPSLQSALETGGLDAAAAAAERHGRRVLKHLIPSAHDANDRVRRRARAQLRYCCAQLFDALAPVGVLALIDEDAVDDAEALWKTALAPAFPSAPANFSNAVEEARSVMDVLGDSEIVALVSAAAKSVISWELNKQ